MIKRKQKAIIGFFLIYLAFVFLITTLLVFSPGLEFIEKGQKVSLKNNSVHIVKNVKIELADGTPVDCIPLLQPGSVSDLNIPEEKRPTKIIAFAPFHATVEKTLLPLGKQGFELGWDLQIPTLVRLEEQFEFSLQLCAKNAALERILIKELHKESLFKEGNENRVIPLLKKGECRTQHYWLTPNRKGITEIRFEIEALDFAKTITKGVKVE